MIVKATSAGSGLSALLRNQISAIDGYCAISDVFKAHYPTTFHGLISTCVKCNSEHSFNCTGQIICSISDNTPCPSLLAKAKLVFCGKILIGLMAVRPTVRLID